MTEKRNLWCMAITLAMAFAYSSMLMVEAKADGPRGSGPVIYVTSQGLFYDSIIGPDLPQRGPFQKLEMGGPTGLQTEFGPGDPGHRGGRWWLDLNNNGEMDNGDAFFSCPLLGPGRLEP